MPNTRIPNAQVPLVDPKTGRVTTDWFNFLFALYQEILWMSSVTDVLIDAKTAENSQTTQYMSPARVKTIVDKFTATNYSGAAATLSVNIVPSGGSVANSNLIITYSLAAGETYTFPEMVGQYLDPGDFISTIAGTASTISIRAGGRQIPA